MMKIARLVAASFLLYGCAAQDYAPAEEMEGENAYSAGDRDYTAAYKTGRMEIVSILDLPNELDISLFSGADMETMKKLIPSGKAHSSISAFLLKLDGKNILIDTGMGSTDPQRQSMLLEGLKTAAVKPEQVDYVILTHLHGDHVGGLVLNGQRVFPNARVLVSEPERTFWMGDGGRRANQENARMARRNLELYGSKVQTFAFGEEIMPGLTAIDAAGHTPGHTALLLEADGGNILFWGDTVHAAALQFPMPEICASYDMNRARAIASRLRLMEMAAKDDLTVAGAHLPFPATVKVFKDSNGGFTYLTADR